MLISYIVKLSGKQVNTIYKLKVNLIIKVDFIQEFKLYFKLHYFGQHLKKAYLTELFYRFFM